MIVAAARCSGCNLDFPTDFKRCARCGVRTSPYQSATPMDRKDALRIARQSLFEREYDKRCLGVDSRCGPRPAGPSPEALGARDARDPDDRDRRILDEIQHFERALRS